jgi:hypothetical protein
MIKVFWKLFYKYLDQVEEYKNKLKSLDNALHKL